MGNSVCIVLVRKSGALLSEVPPDIDVVSLGSGRVGTSVLPLIQFLRKWRPDVLVSSFGQSNVVAIIAALMALSKTKVVIRLHNNLSQEIADSSGWKIRLLPWLYRVFYRWADSIVAVSAGVARDVASVTGVPVERIVVIYNPVLGEQFDSLLFSSDERLAYLSKEATPVFIGVGRLVPQKDFATLIEAFRLFRQRAMGRLVIIGDGPLLSVLMDQAMETGYGKEIDFLGFVPNPLPFMRSAKALILSSRYEGFGNVLVEAMGAGTRVISTDCPFGPTEILDGGRFGKLVPTGDAGAMASAMCEALEEEGQPSGVRERANEFRVKAIAREYLRLVQSVCG